MKKSSAFLRKSLSGFEICFNKFATKSEFKLLIVKDSYFSLNKVSLLILDPLFELLKFIFIFILIAIDLFYF